MKASSTMLGNFFLAGVTPWIIFPDALPGVEETKCDCPTVPQLERRAITFGDAGFVNVQIALHLVNTQRRMPGIF